MLTETEAAEIKTRIVADLYPYLVDAEKLLQQLIGSPSDTRRLDLSPFLYNKERGKLINKGNNIDNAAAECLLRHKDDFAKLGIDIEKRLGVKR